MRPSPEFLAWLGVVVIAACGTSADDVFSTSSGDGDTGGNATTSSSSSSGTTSSSSSSGTTSSSSSSGTTSSSSSSSSGSSSSSSSGSSSSSSSGSSSSSSSGGPTVEIPCGPDTCGEGESCCVPYGGNQPPHCAASGQCGLGWLEVSCNGPNDCPDAEVCCGRYNNTYLSVSCSPDCNNSPQSDGILMCGDDPTICQPGDTCNPSGFLPPGHAYCGN